MDTLLYLHIFGGILLVGNIITAAFWKIRADLSKDVRLIHSTAKNIMIADYCFTIPGILLVLSTGIWMADKNNYPLLYGISWSSFSFYLFTLSGIIWSFFLLPMQRKMIRFSSQSVKEGKISSNYLKVRVQKGGGKGLRRTRRRSYEHHSVRSLYMRSGIARQQSYSTAIFHDFLNNLLKSLFIGMCLEQ
ncbi:DUF2269 family protein [Bacillus carboniphilus]|uniref:DUF2269 family protein n=1 Tax=Bacillus carboniphilus TaxID=86663 RepID=A0ABY9JUZ2_9BACI|nr:DUF2269 family protein [Bacillus carboniphilus]WLR43210.1 DUF2269 family protein [Bacillus carboniphilus]